jgi:hypothetical protein
MMTDMCVRQRIAAKNRAFRGFAWRTFGCAVGAGSLGWVNGEMSRMGKTEGVGHVVDLSPERAELI